MDDDRFYDNDEFEDNEPQTDEEEGYDEEGGDLDKLLDFLTRALTTAPAVPLSGKKLVNADMCLDAIDDIRKNLPEAVQQSMQVLDKRDQILYEAEKLADSKVAAADARAKSSIEDASARAQELTSDAQDRARKILADAEARAAAMVDEHEITRRAQEAAARISEEARADANEQKIAAARYADEILHELELTLQDNVDAVHKSRQNLGRKAR